MAVELLPGHRLTLLNSGAEYFPDLRRAIDQATRDIRLESYIFADDSVGRAIAAALIEAAGRGVRVRVLVDGFGSPEFAHTLLPGLAAAGVEAMVYRPELARLALRRHRLRRLHRKLVLIDDRIAFVGGINLVDDHDDGKLDTPRFDFSVRIEGPVIADIRHAMLRLWEITAWARLKRRPPAVGPGVPEPTNRGDQKAAFIIRDSIRHRRSIERAYLAAILAARQRVLIANAYFLPGRRFRSALIRAARRGVEVTLLLQGCIEYRLQHYATQALYRQLLGAGIRIFEYREGFLHAKVAVIDDRWATVGSSNIDPFSLLLAKEANLAIDNALFAADLNRPLAEALRARAQELPRDHWQKIPWYSRVLRWICYGLVRLAVSLTGQGHRQ